MSALVLAVDFGHDPDPRAEMKYDIPYPTVNAGRCTHCRQYAYDETVYPAQDLKIVRGHTLHSRLGRLKTLCPRHLDMWRENRRTGKSWHWPHPEGEIETIATIATEATDG